MGWEKRQWITHGNTSGFSLVEVVSSLGIVSFGLVALLGLMPVGLQATRESRSATAEALVVRHFSSITNQCSAKQLQDLAEPTAFYFDEQGLEVTEKDPTAIYRATLTLENQAAGLTALTTVHVRLRRIQGVGATQDFAFHRAVVE